MSYKVTPKAIGALKLNETDTVKSALQSVAIILRTWEGTVPLYRDFGISSAYIHMPILAAKALLRAEIKEKVERYEPRVTVTSITFQQTDDGLIPTLEVEIHEEKS